MTCEALLRKSLVFIGRLATLPLDESPSMPITTSKSQFTRNTRREIYESFSKFYSLILFNSLNTSIRE